MAPTDASNTRPPLKALGLSTVPIGAREQDWANGTVQRAVARVAGFAFEGERMLASGTLRARIDCILAACRRFAAQLLEHAPDTLLPERPRSSRDLAYACSTSPTCSSTTPRTTRPTRPRRWTPFCRREWRPRRTCSPMASACAGASMPGGGGRVALVLQTLGIEPDGPVTDADFAGLPMPRQVWGDEKRFA